MMVRPPRCWWYSVLFIQSSVRGYQLTHPRQWFAQQPRQIEVYRIKSPRLAIHHSLDDREGVSIKDPELYYDHHNGEVYYLATWKGDEQVIGIMEVAPDVWMEDSEGNTVRRSHPRGLVLDCVATAKQYRRRGVATALFRAVENDAYEMMHAVAL